jgi:hypothetical protein
LHYRLSDATGVGVFWVKLGCRIDRAALPTQPGRGQHQRDRHDSQLKLQPILALLGLVIHPN